jgi:hypothetical protein
VGDDVRSYGAEKSDARDLGETSNENARRSVVVLEMGVPGHVFRPETVLVLVGRSSAGFFFPC